MVNRRSFLLGGAAVAGGTYIYNRGIRFPRIGLTPRALSNSIDLSGSTIILSGLIFRPTLSTSTKNDISLRAFQPEPTLLIDGKVEKTTFEVGNIPPSAVLTVRSGKPDQLHESQSGINRTLTLANKLEDPIELEWSMGNPQEVSFAVIGDTGGNLELEWCLKRADELGAQFLFHLGDFNYGNGDYQRAIDYFNQSPIPCYICIGNHDFNDSGLVYDKFTSNLSPLNHAFTIAGTRFVNFDTGADFFPVDCGLRGPFLNRLVEHAQPNQLFFTHRPLRDPRPGEDHIVGGQSEINWLVDRMVKAGGGPLLTGHVHHSAELNIEGVKQYTVGEGLGHEDILLQRQVAKMMIGTVAVNQKATLEWVPINMPWDRHTSHTHAKKLRKRQATDLLEWYQNRIKQKA